MIRHKNITFCHDYSIFLVFLVNFVSCEWIYRILNDVFERALQEMQTIIAAQRLRYSPQRAARADVFKSLGIF